MNLDYDYGNTFYGFDIKEPASNNIRTKRSAEDYKVPTEHERAFYKKEMYIGSGVRDIKEAWIYDFSKKCLILSKIDTPDALSRITLEIISNAGDNITNSRGFGVDPGIVEFTMDESWISVKSYGEPIPLTVRNDFSTIDKPATSVDIIFGTLGSGSNFDTDVTRVSNGTNGLGSKMTNVMSRVFQVTVGDPKNGCIQQCEWTHNKKIQSKSIITPPYIYNNGNWIQNGERYTGQSFVQIRWKVDFRVFNYPENKYDITTAGLFAKYMMDLSFNCKVPIIFNGEKYDFRKISDYSNLYFPKALKNIIHYEWLINKPSLTGKPLEDFVSKCENSNSVPMLEIGIIDTPNNGTIISFVNGMITGAGGVHVNAVKDILFDKIKEFFKNDKSGLGDKITANDIKKHVTLIINCHIENPMYSGQTKDILKSPKIKDVVFTDDEIKKIKKFDLIEMIYKSLENKINKESKKTNGTKRKHIVTDKGEDANFAGTNKSQECVLMITEGLSASGYIMKYILEKEGAKDRYGILPIKGKLLNVTDAPFEQIRNNEEINNIKKLMGLREEEIEIDYSTPAGANTLRYGMIIICADSDLDAAHIVALLMNYFYIKFPTFLKSGRFCFLTTPIIRAISNNKTLQRFYNIEDFNKWKLSPEGINFDPKKSKNEIKYFKGLASSNDSDIIEDSKFSSTVICIFDEDAADTLNIAFKKDKSNERKEWIKKYRDALGVEDILIETTNSLWKRVNISKFNNTKLVEYSVDTFSRSLPSFRDGLKKSQRQLIYTLLHKWNYGKSDKKTAIIDTISSDTKLLCHYHHGSESLNKAIIKLAQNYSGSNNLNAFYQDGQFGTRKGNEKGLGEDAGSSRYISSKHEWWLKYVFHKELVDCVDKVIVDDNEAEPIWLPCDIPLHVINGCRGLSTAFSVYIPNYHPIDVIDYIIAYISGGKLGKLVPWFKGFNGNVDIELKKRTKKDTTFIETMLEEDPDYQVEEYEGLTLKTEGLFTILNERTEKVKTIINGAESFIDQKVSDIHITEIPIDIAIFKYYKWLETLIESEKILDVEDKNKGIGNINTPNIIIKGWRGPVNKKDLKLSNCDGMNNITLICDNSFPIPLKSISEVMGLYCDSMIELYKKYHQNKLLSLKEDIDFNSNLLKLHVLINDGSIIITKTRKSEIDKKLIEYNIPSECFEKVTATSLLEDGIDKLNEKLRKLLEEYNILFATEPLRAWFDRLMIFRAELCKRNEFKKLPHHIIREEV